MMAVEPALRPVRLDGAWLLPSFEARRFLDLVMVGGVRQLSD